MEDKNPIQVADRLFGALELLAENGDAGVMEVSTALGLNKSTAHRVPILRQQFQRSKEPVRHLDRILIFHSVIPPSHKQLSFVI